VCVGARQALDGALSLKMNDPNIIFQNMHRVFRAMVVLELPNKSEYTKGLLMNLIFMHHNKRQNSPMWQAWKQDPSAWNEEKGESALGTLARIQNGRGNGTKLDVTNAKWAMIHQHSVVGNGFMNETMDWDNADRPVTVEKDCASVLHTRTWLQRTIHQLHTNQYRVCTDRDLLAFEEVAQQNLAPAKKIAVFLEMDFEAQVRKRIPAFTSQQVSFWVDKDSPKDIHGNTKADRQLAWPVPAGAPQPAEAVLDAADQNSCSDDSADAEEPIGAGAAALPPSDEDDEDDDIPLSAFGWSQPRGSAGAAAMLKETETEKAARLRTAEEKRLRKRKGHRGRESRQDRWDYEAVSEGDDGKDKASLIVEGKRRTPARVAGAMRESTDED